MIRTMHSWFTLVYFTKALASSRLSTSAPCLTPRIVGGDKVDIQKYPYQVSMLYKRRHICGGSILSPNFVITAAHCTYRTSSSQISFRGGSSTRSKGGQVVKAKTVHQHPKFNFDTFDYDVAIVEVTPRFTYNEQLRNIRIGTSEPREGTLVTASGWGAVSETSNRIPNELRAVQIPVVSRINCKKAYTKRATITNRMICAGVPHRGGRDTCQSDSGGPLVSRGKLVGVVSWGFECASHRYPGVYTNLNNKEIRNYIKTTTRI